MIFKKKDSRQQRTIIPERQEINEMSPKMPLIYCMERVYRLWIKEGTQAVSGELLE